MDLGSEQLPRPGAAGAVPLPAESQLALRSLSSNNQQEKPTTFMHAECLLASWNYFIYFSSACAKYGRALKLIRSLIFSVPNNSFKILNEFMLRRKPLEVRALEGKLRTKPNDYLTNQPFISLFL